MKATLIIDDDVLNEARSLSEAEGRSLGSVISELARRELALRSKSADGDSLPVVAVTPGANPNLEKRPAAPEDSGQIDPPKPPPTFRAWVLSTKYQRLRKLLGLLAVLLTGQIVSSFLPSEWPASLAELGRHFETIAPQRAQLMFLQAVVCFFIALGTPRGYPQNIPLYFDITPERKRLVEKGCERVQRYLVAIFLSWTAYYVISGCSVLLSQNGFVSRVFVMSLSSVTTVLIYWLYIELSEITVDGSGLKASDEKGSNASPQDLQFVRLISLGVVLGIIILGWYGCVMNSIGIIEVADTLLAILSGVSLALVVGRLGSKHLNPGPMVIGLLYLYAIMQPAAAAFGNPAIQLIATTLALPLKILLWLVCVWAFTTGVFAEYAYELRDLITQVDAKRSSGDSR